MKVREKDILLGLSMLALVACSSDSEEVVRANDDVTPVNQPKEDELPEEELPVENPYDEILYDESLPYDQIPVLATIASGKTWVFQPEPSDDFNYTFEETDGRVDFGPNNKWYNFYHDLWDGPGTTYWKYDHVSVDGNDLVIRSSRRVIGNESEPRFNLPPKMNLPDQGVSTGSITGNNRVQWPVFVEAKVSVADMSLASDVWLLSADNKQEIDIIECWGGDENGNQLFSNVIHLAHHSFVRPPDFQDYQPRDLGIFYRRDGVSSWGEFHYNGGDRKYTHVGVNWISPIHLEYYIDGRIVRALYDKAVATKRGNEWTYGYPTMSNGVVVDTDSSTGFQALVEHSTSSSYSFDKLKAASDVSEVSIIDPYNYQDGGGMGTEKDIIINVESQTWQAAAGRIPTNAELEDPEKNTMKVDWIRVFKPM